MRLVFREHVHGSRVSVEVHDGTAGCGHLELSKVQWYSLRLILETSGGRFDFESAADIAPSLFTNFAAMQINLPDNGKR